MDKSQASKLRPVITHVSHWKLIEDYLAVEIDRLVTQLQTCEEKDLKRLQGGIATLRSMQALPEQLKREQGTTR